jgi:hypothetical protein
VLQRDDQARVGIPQHHEPYISGER